MRLGLLIGSLTLALLIAVMALQTPAPRGLDTPATDFAAARAMLDVRQIARAPHPVGTVEHARVRAYLSARMTQLGLDPQVQAGALSPAAVARMQRMGRDPADAGNQAINLVGVLPGRDPAAPAVLMMAHYDSVPGSPGAADDASGVAAILEAVRAIRARGPIDRSLVVLFTDAEELNLDGARVFFSEHPLRDRIGAVVNLEARGGGGRASMFETGRGNGETIPLFSRAAAAATGGPATSSLAVFVYGLMPNGTDFTVPRDRGIGGVNLAFIGRPAQYHSPTSTPEALDQGSVQHIGSLALETADAMARAERLPQAAPDRVFSDVLGLAVVGHTPGFGWVMIGLTALLMALAAWGARRAAGLTPAQVGRGMLDGLWLVASAIVVAQALRVMAGPIGGRVQSAEAYYTLLRRLPWMEAGAALAVLGLSLLVLAGRGIGGRRVTAGVLAVAAILSTVLGGPNPVVIGAAVLAVVLSLWPRPEATSTWGGWLGLIALVFVMGVAAQAAAPTAAFLFVWTALLAALAAAVAAVTSASLTRRAALIPAAAIGAVGGAWLLTFGHGVYLGVGMDLPGALGLIGLLILMLVRPLSPPSGARRAVAVAAAACLIAGAGLSLYARVAEPVPPPDAFTPL